MKQFALVELTDIHVASGMCGHRKITIFGGIMARPRGIKNCQKMRQQWCIGTVINNIQDNSQTGANVEIQNSANIYYFR